MLLFWLTTRSRAAKTVKATTTVADKPLPTFNQANNYVYPQQLGPDGGPVFYDPSGQDPVSSYPLKQNTTATLLSMAPITPVPPQQFQSMQERMQALQFSSHPRPNFVTTVHGGEFDSSNPLVSNSGLSGAPRAAWQPTPFVPPAQLASSNIDRPFPSVLNSPSATTVLSGSSPGQSSHDPQTVVSQHAVNSYTLSEATSLPPPTSIPHYTRPSPDIELSHIRATVQNHPHTYMP